MDKPDTPAVGPPSRQDYDVAERAVRALQGSELHTTVIHCMAGDPEHPDDETRMIDLPVVCVTDGTRGFLVLSGDFAAPKSDVELLEFMRCVVGDGEPAGQYVPSPARMIPGEPGTLNSLDLTHPAGVRETVEAAYEEAFRGKGAANHKRFFESFTALGFRIDDEEASRNKLRDLDSF